mgnify:CR=1 FL=1
MSAYIMSHDDINRIVGYFVDTPFKNNQVWASINGEYCYLSRDNAEEVAKLLYNQNVRSVDTRYSEKNDNHFEYKFIGRDKTSFSAIVGLLSSYDYQACETKDYYTTEAFYLIARMQKTLLDSLVEEEVDAEELLMWTR